jgi:hypothetical protein
MPKPFKMGGSKSKDEDEEPDPNDPYGNNSNSGNNRFRTGPPGMNGQNY